MLNSRTSSEQMTISVKRFRINSSSVEYFVVVTIKMTNIKLELIADSFGVLIFWNNSSCFYRNDLILNKIIIHIPVNVIFPFGGFRWYLTWCSFPATVFWRIRQGIVLNVLTELFFRPFVTSVLRFPVTTDLVLKLLDLIIKL